MIALLEVAAGAPERLAFLVGGMACGFLAALVVNGGPRPRS